MTAVTATKENIVAAIERFPKHIQQQFLIDRMDMFLGFGAISQQGGEGYKILHIHNPEEAEELLQFRLEGIRRCEEIHQVFWFVNKSDRLQLLQFLSGIYVFENADYATLLRDAWISTEFPHQMKNNHLINMFEKADRRYLMTDEENKALEAMPDVFPVYRGWSEKQVKKGLTKRRGLSWTTDENVADWFANRWQHGDGCVTSALASKKEVYMYTDERNEREVVVNPAKLRKIKKL
jgi:hypothetical protein